MTKHQKYSLGLKLEAVRCVQAGETPTEVARSLGIKNKTQVKTWAKWAENGEVSRLDSSSGRPHPKVAQSEVDKLKLELQEKDLEIALLKKFQTLEKRWCQKHL